MKPDNADVKDVGTMCYITRHTQWGSCTSRDGVSAGVPVVPREQLLGYSLCGESVRGSSQPAVPTGHGEASVCGVCEHG